MAGGLLIGAAVSYGLVEWAHDGGLAAAFPRPDWSPWLWAGALALMALMLGAAYFRTGRGICAAVPAGCGAAAAIVHDAGHAYLVAPLLTVAAACIVSYCLAAMVEQRFRRPA